MAVYTGSDPPPTGNILAYNSHSDRGWNDPPTLAFAPSSGGNNAAPRKRLDLRKRVAHNCVGGGAAMNTAMQAMNLNGQQMNQHPVNYQHNNYSRSASSGTPNTLYNGQNMPFQSNLNTVHNSVANATISSVPPMHRPGLQMPVMSSHSQTPPFQPNMDHSLQNHHLVHAASMPNLQQHLNGSVPQIDQVSKEHNFYKPPSGGNVSNPIFNSSPQKPPMTCGEASTGPTYPSTSHVGQPLFYFTSKEAHPAVANAVNTATNDVRSTADIGLLKGESGKYEDASLNTNLATLSTDVFDHAHHVRSTSMPNFKEIKGPGTPGQNTIAPPVDGYYTKRSSSACSSRQRTPSPVTDQSTVKTENLEDENNDAQIRSKTLEHLNTTLERCSLVSDQKLMDDVRKRICLFNESWKEGKLSSKVKEKMSILSTALSNNELKKADSIHQSLIVDFSNEVRQWMVGIKKIIMLCQQMEFQNIKH